MNMKKLFALSGLWIALLCIAPTGHAIELVLDDIWFLEPGGPTRITCDVNQHLLMVSIPRASVILTISQNGEILNTVSTLAEPSALALDAQGDCYVVDERAVRKISADGSLLFTLGGSDTYFSLPRDVAVGPDGRIYVADACDSILIFDIAGNYVSGFGGHGWFYGQLNVPVNLAISTERGELIVTDQINYRIQVYTLDGDSLYSWGRLGNGNYAPGEFLLPWGLDIDAQGRIWTYDAILDAVQVFDSLGSFLYMCRLEIEGFRGGVDLAIDGDRAYLTAPATESVYVFQILENEALPRTVDYNLTIHPENDGLSLRWNPVDDAVQYRLYRSATTEFTQQSATELGVTIGTSFFDATALALTERGFYRVVADFAPGLCNVPEAPVEASQIEEQNGGGIILENHDGPHNMWRDISCRACHYAWYDYPDPLPEWWFADHLCKSCHVESGMAPAQQNHVTSTSTMYCSTCHDPHFQQDQYPHDYIRTAVLTPNSSWRAVTYNAEADFVHGTPEFDGICEVCHTATTYYRNDGTGESHYAGENCLSCHSHLDGFAASTD